LLGIFAHIDNFALYRGWSVWAAFSFLGEGKMGLKIASAAIIVSSALMTCSGAALADPSPVTATLSATYFEVLGSPPDADFNVFNTPNVADGSLLGPDGFPVVTPPGINDVGPSNQITWWSPAFNSNVKATGGGTISLPSTCLPRIAQARMTARFLRRLS
jgi:hypothetical protein